MKGRSLRYTVLTGIATIAVSAALIVGASFAWFSDSISNKGNRIQAGNLRIEAYAYAQNAAKDGPDAATEQNLRASGAPVIDETGFTPGMQNVKYFKVENAGDVPLKVKVKFTLKDGGLAEALWFDFVKTTENWAADVGTLTPRSIAEFLSVTDRTVQDVPVGGALYFKLCYGMSEGASGDYSGKEMSLDVTVLATQADDVNFDRVVAVTQAADFASPRAGVTYVLAQDVTAGALDFAVPVNLKLNGFTLTCDSFRISSSELAVVTVSGGSISATGNIEISLPRGTVNVVDVNGVTESGSSIVLNGSRNTVNLKGDTSFRDRGGAIKAITIPSDTRVVVESAQPISLAIAENASGVTVVNAGESGVELSVPASATEVTADVTGTVGTIVTGGEGAVNVTSGGYTKADADAAGIAKGFAGGDGTPAFPFEITTPEEFSKIAELSADMNAGNAYRFALMNDVDFTGKTGYAYVNRFRGTLDGRGHSLTNVSTATFADGALINEFAGNSAVRNLSMDTDGVNLSWFLIDATGSLLLEDITISGKLGDAGANDSPFLSQAMGKAVTFRNCVSRVEMISNSYAGVFLGGYIIPKPASITDPAERKTVVSFIDCVNYGTVYAPFASMLRGSANRFNAAEEEYVIEGCVNEGKLVGTEGAGLFCGHVLANTPAQTFEEFSARVVNNGEVAVANLPGLEIHRSAEGVITVTRETQPAAARYAVVLSFYARLYDGNVNKGTWLIDVARREFAAEEAASFSLQAYPVTDRNCGVAGTDGGTVTVAGNAYYYIDRSFNGYPAFVKGPDSGFVSAPLTATLYAYAADGSLIGMAKI